MTTKRTVPVQILGQEYRLRTDADEDFVQRSATLVDETMRRIQGRTGTVDTRDLAVLTALNLANRVMDEAGAVSTLPDERLTTLIELVESTLEEAGPDASAR
jgi:cell division protein ZapA